MTEEKEEKGGIKVQDKRRFDSDGQERSDAQAIGKPANAEAASSGLDFQTVPSSGESKEPGIDFSSFVMSLGTQALMLLGHIKAPDGVDLQVDKVAAKQTIDILSMIEEKTKGNLDATESNLIEQVLHSLRVAFVKAI